MFPKENEIYIDGGCYDGGTVLDFLEFSKDTRRIYGFEPDPDCYMRTKKTLREHRIENAILLQKGLWNETATLRFDRMGLNMAGSRIAETGSVVIEATSIDAVVDPSETVTFIKMDIEGAELNALRGAANTIRRCLPRLAICIYHKPEDIVEIPCLILSLSPKYVFYIRHHVPWVNHESVLYAIAKP